MSRGWLELMMFLLGASPAPTEIGPKVQIYPAGVISSVQVTRFWNDRSAINYEFGYNLARRQDFGVHDNEEGGGLGFGIGYRAYIIEKNRGLYAEVNIETWFLEIDWTDANPTESGQTYITVLQPTLGTGYQFRSKDENWAATLGAAFGREWNAKTKGEEVGQGGISLLTFSVTRRL